MDYGKYVRDARCAWLAVLSLMAAVGCATDPFAGQHVDPYVPRVAASDRPGADMPAIAPPAAVAPPASTADVAVAVEPAVSASGPTRQLRRDDRLLISMRGIPRPEELADVVDGDGRVKLPYIGAIKVEGLTTSEAELAIERAYVAGQYFSKIDVIVVAQEESFFVRGEVVRPGKYPLIGDTSLVMAITAAGGYTDFANPRKIQVIRGRERLELNGERIENRQDAEFLINPNDVIVVERKIFL